MKEITIIGGGLAGLALGVYLRKLGVPVTLYEAGQYPRHRVCGEFICGVEDHILREMGLDVIIDGSTHHRQMAWFMEDRQVLDQATPMVAWGLSRYALDQTLAQTFQQSGGILHLNQRKNASDASGVVFGQGKRKSSQAQEWIGLKVHLEDASHVFSGLEMHVGMQGYLGACAIEGNRVNCCGLFKLNKAIKGRGSELLLAYLEHNGLHALADRMRSQTLDQASFSAIAGFSLGAQERVGSFCLGDSSYLIPPFTGNGMSMALESSYIAGQYLAAYSTGELSWNEAVERNEAHVHKTFRKRMRWAEAIHPLLFSEIGRKSLQIGAQTKLLPINFLFNTLRTP